MSVKSKRLSEIVSLSESRAEGRRMFLFSLSAFCPFTLSAPPMSGSPPPLRVSRCDFSADQFNRPKHCFGLSVKRSRDEKKEKLPPACVNFTHRRYL